MTITRADGTVDDVTDIVDSGSIVDSVTEGIGNFEIRIPNPNETYTGVWTGMEIFRYKCDYASGTPTTLRFRARVEKVRYTDNQVILTGRTESLFVMGKTVTMSFSAADIGEIIYQLFSTYGEGRFDLNSINRSTGTTLTINFIQLGFWEAVQKVCEAAGYDCHIDCNLVVQFNESSSVANTTDAIVHEHNLIEVGDFANDLSQVKNRIIIYGANDSGIQVIYTAEDETSQTDYGVRELIVNDENILTYGQAKELADALLADNKDPPQVGEITGVLLATIQPGQTLRCSSPADNIPPAAYPIVKYEHKFGDDDWGFITVATINKEPRKVAHIFKTRIENEAMKQDTSVNPHEMRYSMVFSFDTSEGTHTNTQVSNSTLKLQTGQNLGNWISPPRTESGNISQVYVVATGQTLDGAVIEVSANGGVSYETVTLKELKTLTTAAGSTLQVKVTIDNNSTEVDGLSVLYKLG